MKKTAKILVAILIASLLVGALGVLAFAKEPVSGAAPKTGLVKTTQLANGNYFRRFYACLSRFGYRHGKTVHARA